MDGGDDRSGRDRQIDLEDDQSTNRIRVRNGDVMNQPQNKVEVDDKRNPLLTLAPPTGSSQIQPQPSSLRLSPAPPLPDFVAQMNPYMMTQPPYMVSNNSFHHMGSLAPPVNYFTQPTFAAPSNQPPTLSLNSGDESSRRSSRSGNQRSETILPPFPWATNIRGKIQTLEQLESKQITRITGDVQCKHCEKVYQVRYDLRERFSEVENIFALRKAIMRERAPPQWTHPEAAKCEFCGREKTVKPVIATKKCKINWLFLLLGQTLGYCTLEQLKYFCKHSKSHRTGAKDRVLYLTYLGLCKMLQPNRDLFRR